MSGAGARAPRVGVACVFHESNTGIGRRTTLADFRRRTVAPERIVAEVGGTQTALGGLIDRGLELGFELVPLVYAWAIPSGEVARDAFETLAAELDAALRAAGPLDGLLLELHGAMTAEGHVRADAELAQTARAAAGDVPIVAVVDPHANLSDGLVEAVDGLLAYQRNPHVDMAARGRDGADVLARLLARRERPAIVVRRVPVTAPAIAQATAEEPLASLTRAARELEQAPGVVSASLLFGFPYADVPDVGMAAVVCAEDPAQATAGADWLAGRAWALRERFARRLLTPAEAIAQAVGGDGPVAIADTGDNIGGGAPGDRTELLRAALDHGRVRFATTMWAPEAVAAAGAAGVGAELELTFGEPALTVTARVRDLRDGSFVHDGPLSAGVRFEMGPIAVLEVGWTVVVAQTHAIPPNDQALFRSAGVAVDALDAIGLKGAAAIRAGWRSAVSGFLDAATPGTTTSDLRELPLTRVARPLWPLDPDATFAAAPASGEASAA